jgi:superfamily II DNA/RNA helicase
MGFIPDVEKICTLIKAERQTLLFSATMPPPIKKLADRFMTNPKMVEVSRPATTNADIAQSIVLTDSRSKRDVLKDLIFSDDVRTGIIFCNRKTTVRDLAATLKRSRLKVGQIHGDMEQADRIRELDRFKAEEINILVASDVAARGLDIKGVSHVFNYDAPWHPDDYVHRIGRTGRAGQKGVAITLVTPEDAEAIAQIEKLTGQKIPRRSATGPTKSVEEQSIGLPEAAADAAPAPRGRRPKPAPAADAAPAPSEPAAETEDGAPRRDRRTPRARQARDARERAPAAAPARAEPVAEAAPRPEGTERPERTERSERPQRSERPRDDRRPRSDSRGPRPEADRTPRGEERGRQYREPRDDGPPIGPGFGEEGVPAFLQVSARS